jgi:vacuolar-type H+-ATPase subunit F/Vma7
LCFQREKNIINTKTIVFIFLLKGVKKFNVKARNDKVINPFNDVSQKNEKFKIIFFSKTQPAR